MEEKHSNLNLKEHGEPAAKLTMPVSIMVVLTLLGYIGCYKVDELNANFAANVHAPFEAQPKWLRWRRPRRN